MKCYMELVINLNRKWHIGIVFYLFFYFAWRVGRGGCGIEQHGLLWEGDGSFSF